MKAQCGPDMSKWLFQAPVVRNARAALAKHERVMLRAPTAAGKTMMARRVIEAYLKQGKVIWFLANQKHLVSQAVEELSRIAKGIAIGVIQGSRAENPTAPIQVCSVQSLPKRMARFAAPDLIVFDEAHHVMARSWKRIVDAFPAAEMLGLSATPERMDGKPLGDVFRRLVLAPAEAALEALGVLAPCRYFAPEGVNLGGIKRRRGEFEQKSKQEAMRAPKIVGSAVDHYLSHANGRAGILFAASIKASQEMAKRFVAAGIAAEHLDGETPDDKRAAALERLGAGKTKIICNVDVFVEGLNVPAIGVVILMRPTLSLARFLQMVGRGRRVTDDYPDLIVLDHAGNVVLHGLPNDERSWSLTEARPKAECAAAERNRRCPVCGCAHTFAADCPNCGHIYTAEDPTLAQVFGWLKEIAPSPGCISVRKFAEQIKYGYANIYPLIRRGLPTDANGFPRVIEGQKWFEENVRRRPSEGCETRDKFSDRCGLSDVTITKLRVKGLPVDKYGYPNIKEGMSWLESHGYIPPFGCVTKADFARSCNTSNTVVGGWAKRGMPVTCHGFVIEDAARDWVNVNVRKPAKHGYLTLAALTREFGLGSGSGTSWKRRGLLVDADGYVEAERARQWVLTHVRIRRPGFTTVQQFARLIGADVETVRRWRDTRGLPADLAGMIDESNALAWLKQHAPKYTARLKPSKPPRRRDDGAQHLGL